MCVCVSLFSSIVRSGNAGGWTSADAPKRISVKGGTDIEIVPFSCMTVALSSR